MLVVEMQLLNGSTQMEQSLSFGSQLVEEESFSEWFPCLASGRHQVNLVPVTT